ncbi:MAG: sugar kinase [Myxococcales bacterium]|nr:sugar kinase [Myxococcales bacterium]
MNPSTARSILVVGSVALDSLETPSGHREACLGGSASYFGVGASRFAPVQVVAVVGDDFPEAYLAMFRSHGINLEGLEVVTGGRTFRWRGRYGKTLGDAQTLETQLNVFEQFDPKVLPHQRRAPILFLGNIDPELQLRVLDQMESPHLVALDTMNFWITGKREALIRVLSRVDLLVLNETEARLLSEERNIYRAADVVRAMGPKTLVIKRGEYGSILFHEDGVFVAPAVPLRAVIDPTGAGDTFAAGLIGQLAQQEAPDFVAMKRAVLTGTVLASFTCEGFSLDRLCSVTNEELVARTASLAQSLRVD